MLLTIIINTLGSIALGMLLAAFLVCPLLLEDVEIIEFWATVLR